MVDANRLFGEGERVRAEAARNGMGTYEFFDLSAWPRAQVFRDTVNEWFSHYPAEHRKDLHGRFCTSREADFHGAYFELLLHEILLHHEYRVVVHPGQGQEVKARPDFLVEDIEANAFLVEAVMVRERSDDEEAGYRRLERLLDAIENHVASPDFWIGVEVESLPVEDRSATPIARDLAVRLSECEHSRLIADAESPIEARTPEWTYDHAGARLTFYPVAKAASHRGTVGGRTLAVRGYPSGFLPYPEAITTALTKKARKYGHPEIPLILAFYAPHPAGHSDIVSALYGRLAYAVHRDTEPGHSLSGHWIRERDGLWTQRRVGSQRVSAVLAFTALSPTGLSEASVRLYLNPWASKPCPGFLPMVSRAVVGPDDHLLLEDRDSLLRIVGLDPLWPG
jgi:hypothetical protein